MVHSYKMLLMTKDRRLRSWPFYALAVVGVALGLPMLVTGLKAAPPDLMETVSGRVVSLSWVSDSGHGAEASTTITLEGSERVFVLSTVDAEEQRSAYEQLIGVEVDVLVDRSAASSSRSATVFRLATRNAAGEPVEPPIFNYDHKGTTDVMASRVKSGAVLVVLAAAFVVLGFLVDVWNRNRHEIIGS